MPLYEYECGNCGHRFEVIQKFSDKPIAECPSCKGGPVEKLLSSPAIQFKGSGFYLTDYGRGTGTKSESKAAKPKADGAGDSATKTESSPASSEKTPSAASDSSTPKSTPAKAE